MAEPSNRPGPVAPAPPPSGVPELAPYRPLSLLAIASLGIAALFAAVVLIGGLSAFWSGSPFLMGTWTVIVPLAAAGLAMLANSRIQASEGTLAGAALARWGLLLSLFAGLGYWAYYAATYFAIGNQADTVARQFFEKLAKGELDDAFQLTLGPSNRRAAAGPALRDELELRHNTLNPTGGAGQYTMFLQQEIVRLTRLGGNPKVESRGTSSWEFTSGGFQVVRTYKVSNDCVSFDAVVTLKGVESNSKEAEAAGRQWSVLAGGTSVVRDSRRLTPEGEVVFGRAAQAMRVAGDWLRFLEEGQVEQAYLMTLPVERRAAVTKAIPYLRWLNGLAGGAGGLGLPATLVQGSLATTRELASESVLPGFREFQAGEIIRAQDGVFWTAGGAAAKSRRDQLIGVIRRATRATPVRWPMNWRPEMAPPPIARTVGDRFQVEVDFTARSMHEADAVNYEGRVVLESAAAGDAQATATPDAWRVLAIDLHRARSAPAKDMMMGPGGPG